MRGKAWTEADLAYAADESFTNDEVARLVGRSVASVRHKRMQMANGWSRAREPWTEEELDFLIDTPHLTYKQVAGYLGRSDRAVRRAREKLSRTTDYRTGRGSKNPHEIGPRPLVAKTCTLCGELLEASAFNPRARGVGPKPECRLCARKYWKPRPGRRRDYSDDYFKKMQEATVQGASNSGKEWTGSEIAVLEDPSLTLLQKALRLGRTYASVNTKASRIGARSLNDRRIDQSTLRRWHIWAPNAEVALWEAS